MNDMYLGGRGVMRETKRLNDKVWEALPLAFVGGCVATCGPLIAYAVLIHNMPWQPPATPLQVTMAWMLSIMSVVVGVTLNMPWRKAIKDVRRHTELLKAETAKRGKGWADGR